MQLKQILFFLLLFLIASCSKETKPDIETEPFTAPKAVQYVTTYNFNGEPDTVSIVYNEAEQISERHFNNQISFYEYENDLLIKEKNFYDFQLDTSHYERTYEYDEAQRVSKIIHFDRPGTPELTPVYEYLFDYVSASKVEVTNRGVFYDYSATTHYFFEGADIEKTESFDGEGDLSTEVFFTYTDILRPAPFDVYWLESGLHSKHLPASVKIIDHTGLLDLVCAFELDFQYEKDNQDRPLQSDNSCYTVDFEY